MYGKIVRGKIEYAPKNYVTPNGALIINFNKNEEIMKKHGFLEVEDIRPAYNPNFQEIIHDGYEVTETKIKFRYIVIDKPAMLSLRDEEPSLEDRVAELESKIEELTRKINE